MSEVLQTIIPAGGQGSRLHPHSLILQKPLMPMGSPDRCLIDDALDIAAQTNGTFILAPSDERKTEGLGDHVTTRIDTHLLRDPRQLGAASLIYFSDVLFQELEGSSLILSADHIVEGLDLNAFYHAHKEMGMDITVLTTGNKPYGQYVYTIGSYALKLLSSPAKNSQSSTGIYIVRNSYLLEWAESQRKNGWRGEFRSFVHDAVAPAINSGRVAAHRMPITSHWDDAGTLDRYFYNNMRRSDNVGVVARGIKIPLGASVAQSILLGTVSLSENEAVHREIRSGNSEVQYVTRVA